MFGFVLPTQTMTLKLDRTSISKTRDARALRLSMHRTIADRGCILTTASTLKTLLLQYVAGQDRLRRAPLQYACRVSELKENLKDDFTVVHQHAKALRDQDELCEELGDALKLLRRSVAIIDEADLVLHPMKSELNFPLGPKKTADRVRWELPTFLFSCILDDDHAFNDSFSRTFDAQGWEKPPLFSHVMSILKRMLKKGKENGDILEMPHFTLLRKQFYTEQIREHIATIALFFIERAWCKEQLERERNPKPGPSLGAEKFDHESWVKVVKFLQGTTGPNALVEWYGMHHRGNRIARNRVRAAEPTNASQAALQQDSVVKVDGSHPAQVLQVHGDGCVDVLYTSYAQNLNLARLWVARLLPHCLSKRNRVQYGLVLENDLLTWARQDFWVCDRRKKKTIRGKVERNRDREKEILIENFPCGESRMWLAVPFGGRDKPSRTAEFASADVAIGLTLLSFRYTGLRPADIKRLVAHLKTKMERSPMRNH